MRSYKLNSGLESFCRKAVLAATLFAGVLGAAAAHADMTPVFPFVKPVVACEVVSTSTIDDGGKYGLKDKDGNLLTAGLPVTYPDLVLFKAYCYVTNYDNPKVTKPVTGVNSLITYKFPDCNTAVGQVCSLYKNVIPNAQLTGQRTLVAEFLVQNKSSVNVTIKPTDLVGQTAQIPEAPAVSQFTTVPWSPFETPIYPPVKDAKCRVIVSGATESTPEGVENPSVMVANGKLIFTASVTGISGVGGEVTSIKWTGGPDANGAWENPPLNVESLVTAQVSIKAGQTMTCGIKVKPSGDSFGVGLSRFGDCGFFGSTRSYYYRTPDNKSVQASGYNKPIQFVGLPIKYGVTSPDIPFRGVVNGAFSTTNVLETGTNGDVVTPPASVRKYTNAIIVARTFDKTTSKVSDTPVAWGKLDYSNYSNTRMEQLENVNEDESIVFQVYLAAAQIKDGVDLRGSTLAGAIPLHSFRPGTSDNKPFDRMVPFVNNSCGLMTIPVPARSDKDVTPEMQALKMCTFSKAYQMKDLKSGRVNLDVMHVVAEHGEQMFPTNLLKTMNKETSCNPNGAKKDCWNVSASSLGINASAVPFQSHESCREVKIIDTPTQVCGGSEGGCTTVSVPTTIVTYKAGCNVVEPQECGPGMAIRFSGYNQMMLGALGCAAKYDRPGEKVAATLLNQGIIPYTSFGGSAPKHYSTYPNAYGQTNGYACIPCRFASDANKVGADVETDTAALPVDQDQTTPRKPVYSFSKSSASADCVKNVTFEVRYFGSGACDGVNVPPGHFCSSGNIQAQNCSTSDTVITAKSPFAGGGNVAGKFQIPICPGSGIEYESVSVSWSPIILDIKGNGISITRSFDMARQFDIRGDNRMRVLDWPLNNEEVAFLVRPNKGKVTSIKELFGDYKAKNGFEALRKLDSNKDGVINRKDKAFAELSLWFDRNRNAKLDPGELEGLDVNGVFDIPLVYAKPNRKGADGRTLAGVYFNHKQQRYMNIEDHYFYEYISSGQKMSQK